VLKWLISFFLKRRLAAARRGLALFFWLKSEAASTLGETLLAAWFVERRHGYATISRFFAGRSRPIPRLVNAARGKGEA